MSSVRVTSRAVTWSAEDGEHVGLCAEFPSLSWLAATPEEALAGMRQLVAEVVADLSASGEPVPVPLADRTYSGEFRVRIPPELHRALAIQAAEQKVSLNRLASAKLAVLEMPVEAALGDTTTLGKDLDAETAEAFAGQYVDGAFDPVSAG